MDVVIRPVTEDDAGGYTRLRNLVVPYLVVTAAGTLYQWRTASPESQLLVLVAERGGEIVGTGRAARNTWTSTEGVGMAAVEVHPEHRGRGIGGQLHARVEDHLRGNGVTRLRGWAVDEAPVARWCERLGYTPTERAVYSRLDLRDLTALPPTPPVPDGVRLASYAEVGPEAVYAVDAAAMKDEPGDVVVDAVTYREWYDDLWMRPQCDHAASTVALVDGRPATISTVEADPLARRMWSGGTGTLREYRGRGLAKLVKSVAVRRAAAAGITEAYTANDESNGPMLAVNTWLGYRPHATQVAVGKSV